jgi:hypothetical protein
MDNARAHAVRICIFCSAALRSGNRTREHVFPDWMLRHFKIGDHVIAPQSWRGTASVSGARRHPLAAFRFGGVCGGCNHGWMSKLEQKVKPVLLALSSDERHLPDLTHNEQILLSRWTRKTALVLHAASYSPPVIPRSIYTLTKERPKLCPPGISVVAMQTPDLAEDILAVSALQSDRFILILKPGTADDFARWKISLRVGILQLLVTYWSNPSWNIVGWRDVHMALWPERLSLFYSARLRRDLVVARKESGTVLFHVSLGISTGLNQQDIDLVSRPPLEQELERNFSGSFFSPRG